MTFSPPEADTLDLEDRLRAELARIADPDGRLPAERELAARFGVGRTRLRRALAALELDGLLFRRESTTGAVQALVRASGGAGVELNAALHAN